MLRLTQLNLPLNHDHEALALKICKTLHIQRDALLAYKIHKRSIDARKKPDIRYSYTVDVKIKGENKVLRRSVRQVTKIEEKYYHIPAHGQAPLLHRPVVIGSGPAGLFCAYLLAKSGFAPVLYERGAAVEERLTDVENFWKTGVLKSNSNVQFGEGGAGTFSDGKLNTLVKDTQGRSRFVLETFVRFGAPEDILYEQKPHIGTDILIQVVKNMREEIIRLGGKIHFNSQMTDVEIGSKDIHKSKTDLMVGKEEIDSAETARHIIRVQINNETWVETDVLVLALGHSARDTFQMLLDRKFSLEAKSFAVGVRIEHPQNMISENQYGQTANPHLPAAAYKLAEKLENGRGVYTFCMCPGGYVVNASSEEGRLAVNGMSYHDRAGENANSAVIVTVTPEDFGAEGPLAGVTFQRELEESAFRVGKGKVPVQCFKDFCKNQPSKELGAVKPQIKGSYALANVREIFPGVLGKSLEEGISLMDKKIPGFAREDALLSGVESRTSSPVRILRNEELESNVRGVYPCGEGAGYAGGIMSAAMDGMKVAEEIIGRFYMIYE